VPVLSIHQKREFVPIAPGTVKMGDDGKFEVEITEPFEIMSTPVTQRMWVFLVFLNFLNLTSLAHEYLYY